MTANGKTHKKPWNTPVVRILSRGASEESVLATCKGAWGLFGGPGDSNCSSGQGWPPWYACSNNAVS